jgi:tmRNA-binding protein
MSSPIRSACALLLHKKEIARPLPTRTQGYTCVATSLIEGHKVKCEVALAKGKSNTTNGQANGTGLNGKRRTLKHSA